MILGVTIAALVVALWPARRSSSDALSRQGFALVRRGDLAIEVPATGSLVASRAVDIGPPSVEGLWDFKIARLVDEGTAVKPGDLLIEFDGQEVNRRLMEQEAERDKAQEELNKRKLEYDVQLRDLRIRVEEARVNLEKARHKAEVDASLMSMQDYKQAQIQLELAETEDLRLNEKHRATERMMKAELGALQTSLDKSLRRVGELQAQQKALRITSPTAGVVIFKTDWNGEKKRIGQSAWRMEIIMQIPDLSTLRLEATVEEANAGGVGSGQRARIRMDAFPGMELKGKVVSVGTVLRTKRWDTPIKVVDTIIDFERKGEKLLPGMTGTALIEVTRIPDVLLVPVKAVHELHGRAVVTVQGSDGETEERPIKVGSRNAESVEIKQGLEEGERILS
jgi:multidrug efflux pump subunit AcrA (membrane-fusion protein)